MNQFRAQIRARIQQALAALEEAWSQDDDYLATVYTGELESLVRLAREHGIGIPPSVRVHLAGPSSAG